METEEAVTLGAIYLVLKNKNKKKRKIWCHLLTSARLEFGAFHCMHSTLRNDPSKFFNFYRMSPASFDELCNILRPYFNVKDTTMRKCITVEERIAVTLRYLASGCSLTDLQYIFRIGVSTASGIVKDVCTKVWTHLREITMPMPNEDKWCEIADAFYINADFPNCIGAIDGKHIRVIQPAESGSMFYNYKKYFSIVLLAVCDSNYCFTAVDIGGYGKSCDSALLEHSNFGKQLVKNRLNLPNPRPLPGTAGPNVPFVLVGDEAFGLSCNLMRPYAGRALTVDKRVFNYRLTRARRFIECSFGILANKWRIFHRPLNVSIDFAESIVQACVVLHNFVRVRDGYRFEDTLNCEGFDNLPNVPTGNQRARTPQALRTMFTEYFVNPAGERAWQYFRI